MNKVGDLKTVVVLKALLILVTFVIYIKSGRQNNENFLRQHLRRKSCFPAKNIIRDKLNLSEYLIYLLEATGVFIFITNRKKTFIA